MTSAHCFTATHWILLQCINDSDRCDGIKHCMDGHDEALCPFVHLENRPVVKSPMIVEFLPTGDIARRQLRPDTGSMVHKACPETHFWCSDKEYCLPVFVRCNGVFDCLGHEDERDCITYTCPGFYRCRASKVCVHVTHVCDGWPQCPLHDDELLCSRPCPLNCTCYGLAFFCSQVFAAHQFPDLRYLDVRGSGMNTHQLGYNGMLIHLSLARCKVRTLSNFTFNNLRSLDLSDNLLTEVSGRHLTFMPQLTVLFLAGNPLISVINIPTGTHTQQHKLSILDLSNMKTLYVDTSLLMMFPNLQTLNLSYSGVELLQWNSSLKPVSAIQEVDLRGCVTAEFSRDVLRGFLHLQLIHTDDFKLCCSSVLPPGFDLNHCRTTPSEIVSCDNLLGSVAYRAMAWVLATLALLGNVVSLTVRVCVRATWRHSSGDVVLTNLSVADLGTGLYLVTLALADRLLAGDYVWQDSSWRKGAVCHIAGALSLSCRHAATFFITILSSDRCLHHCWGLTRHLNPAKARIICAMVWAFSLLLSAVPLVLQWRLFGQHALCVPLPHKLDDALPFYVLVFVHLVPISLCSVCEVLSRVGGTVVKTRIINPASSLKETKFVLLGSLAFGLLYTIVCLVPANTPTDDEKAMRTALVYFASVVSCATNPYLHLCGVRIERRKKIKKERLLMIASRANIWYHYINIRFVTISI